MGRDYYDQGRKIHVDLFDSVSLSLSLDPVSMYRFIGLVSVGLGSPCGLVRRQDRSHRLLVSSLDVQWGRRMFVSPEVTPTAQDPSLYLSF